MSAATTLRSGRRMGAFPARIRALVAVAVAVVILAIASVLACRSSDRSAAPTSRATPRPSATRLIAPELPRQRDVNGDGLDDFVVDTSVGAAVVFGSDLRGDRDPAQLRQGGFQVTTGVAGESRLLGDVDGDGLADIGVTTQERGAYIVFGKRDATAVDAVHDRNAAMTIVGAGSWDDSAQLEPAGDVNGDGNADVLVPPTTSRVLAWLLTGGPRAQGIDLRRTRRAVAVHAVGPWAPDLNAIEAVGLGDVNGDGLDDFGLIAWIDLCEAAVCEQSLWAMFGARRPGSYRLDFRRGSPDGHRRTSAAVRRDDGVAAGFYYAGGCACLVAGATPIGDANGDGRTDLIASVSQDDELGGTAVLLGGRRATTMVPGDGPIRRSRADGIGTHVVGLGDVDGDGAVDIGTFGYEDDPLIVYLDHELRARASTLLKLPPGRGGGSIRALGDIDGDRFADLQITDSKGGSAIVYGAPSHDPVDLARDDSRVLRIG
jgi:hypothetical protein